MASVNDKPIHYSTVDEITALFDLRPPHANRLLSKSLAFIEHGLFEPEDIADKEDRVLWVQQGLDKLVCITISHFHSY